MEKIKAGDLITVDGVDCTITKIKCASPTCLNTKTKKISTMYKIYFQNGTKEDYRTTTADGFEVVLG